MFHWNEMLNWWLPGCTLLYFNCVITVVFVFCEYSEVDTVIVKVDASIVTEGTIPCRVKWLPQIDKADLDIVYVEYGIKAKRIKQAISINVQIWSALKTT